MNERHPFEAAGLGIAPFQWVGDSWADNNCEFCGTAIKINCHVKDSTGRQFIVGSDCILKVSDVTLTRAVKEMKKRRAKEIQAAQLAELNLTWMHDHPLRARLNRQPHPNKWEGRSLLNWMDWMMDNAGKTGKMKVYRAILPFMEEMI